MIKLNTLRFGDIEIDEEKIFTFSQGIPGFDDLKRYIMLQPDEELPFSFMQSVEDGDLALIVTNPFLYFPDYDFELSEFVQKELSITSEKDVLICSVVTISEQGEFSLNLLAPLVLNAKDRVGKQIILYNTEYRTKHTLEKENAESITLQEKPGSKGASTC